MIWNPSRYENIKTLIISSDTIWQPDLEIFNGDVASTEYEFCKSSNCMVHSNGTVNCGPPCLHEEFCLSDYRRWPFDTQNCTMHISPGSSAPIDQIHFRLAESDIPVEVTRSQNREWRMRQSTYRVINGSLPSLIFSFQLDRHSAGHAAVLLGPAMGGILLLFGI